MKEKDTGHNPSVGVDSLYSGGASLPMPSLLSSVPPVTSLAFDQRVESGSGLGVLSSSSLYGYGTLPVCNCGIVVTATIISHNYVFSPLFMSCSTLVSSVCIIFIIVLL